MTICERLGLDLKTVHRYIRAASPEDLLAPRPTPLDPYKAALLTFPWVRVESVTNGDGVMRRK
jgi:hypothetical protein